MVSTIPHASVVKEVICSNCGSTLQYVPNDVKSRMHSDYTGCTEIVTYIECPVCSKEIIVRRL